MDKKEIMSNFTKEEVCDNCGSTSCRGECVSTEEVWECDICGDFMNDEDECLEHYADQHKDEEEDEE